VLCLEGSKFQDPTQQVVKGQRAKKQPTRQIGDTYALFVAKRCQHLATHYTMHVRRGDLLASYSTERLLRSRGHRSCSHASRWTGYPGELLQGAHYSCYPLFHLSNVARFKCERLQRRIAKERYLYGTAGSATHAQRTRAYLWVCVDRKFERRRCFFTLGAEVRIQYDATNRILGLFRVRLPHKEEWKAEPPCVL
jgi:hypothetical protein